MKIDINKYMGKWYEIARIPSSFEPKLTNVSTVYTLMDDGNIKVYNSGYVSDEKIEIQGIAKPTDEDDEFKVTFFNNVESDYKILAVSEGTSFYEVALVGGSNPDYLWIISRSKFIFDSTYNILIDIAKKKGYNADKLEITN